MTRSRGSSSVSSGSAPRTGARLAVRRAVAGALVSFVATAFAAEERDALGPSVLYLPVVEKTAEGGILTPVPIRIALPRELPARRVLAHYRIHGSTNWTALELNRVGSEWRGAIPCLEVSTITGDIVYYIRVHDAEGAVIAYSGSRHQPYRVTIRHDSLRAGRAREPGRCPDPADCPPGLPGCPSEKVERVPCSSDSDCEGGTTCGWEGYCELDTRRYNWLSVEIEAGAGVVSTAGGCSVASQENEGYLCLRRRDGEVYAGRALHTNEPLAVGRLPVRAVLGFERLLAPRASLAVRFGYALAGAGPTPPGGTAFVPYSGELRITRYFGRDPFASAGARAYAFVDAGYAMYDIPVTVRVREKTDFPDAQGGNDLEQTLDAWRRAGDAFVGLGPGLLVVTDSGLGVSAEVRTGAAFPYAAWIVSGRVGARLGF